MSGTLHLAQAESNRGRRGAEEGPHCETKVIYGINTLDLELNAVNLLRIKVVSSFRCHRFFSD